MFTLEASQTLAGVASAATSVTYTITGMELNTSTSAETYKVLAQGQLSDSASTIYTATANGPSLIKEIHLANATGGTITGIKLYAKGTAAANQITGTITIPANGSAVLSGDGLLAVYDSTGLVLSTVTVTLTGDVTGSGTNSIATTIGNNIVTNAKLADVATATFKGRTTAATGDPEDLTMTQATAMLNAATSSLQGAMPAADKKKVDNMYYDVTNYGFVGDDSTDNASAWSTLFALLPVGATVFFPRGTYRTSAEFTISADKHLRIIGAGMYNTIIKTTSATANIFHINGSYWYNQFDNLRFDSTVTKTAGSAIHVNPGSTGSAVGTNISNCSFVNQFTAVHALATDPSGQACNLSVFSNLDISTGPVNSRGIIINSGTCNMIMFGTTINMGYPPFQVAGTACIEIIQSGAVQMLGMECIGGTNTLLLNATQGGSTSVAAVIVVNSFFDQSAGSTLKIAGGNVVNRCKFVQCGITGGNIASATAIEIASTGTGAAGTATAKADGIDFMDCDIYPNGGSGTIQGVLVTGAQGVNIWGCRISGWTNGIHFTPSVSNGYTKLGIMSNKMGATNNFTTPNTVGVLLDAGSYTYGSVYVQGNDFTGSTTPITDNSTVTYQWQKIIGENVGVLSPGGYGTLASAEQALTAGTRIVMSGSSIALPTNGLLVGSRVAWEIMIKKTTAAGTATWQMFVAYGVNNNNTDTAIATWTSGTNTGAIDQCRILVLCDILTLGGSATARCQAYYVNTLTNVTGLGRIDAVPGSTATFNTGLSNPWMHIDITMGASAVCTGVATVFVLV